MSKELKREGPFGLNPCDDGLLIDDGNVPFAKFYLLDPVIDEGDAEWNRKAEILAQEVCNRLNILTRDDAVKGR